jgi:hypothetical protein
MKYWREEYKSHQGEERPSNWGILGRAVGVDSNAPRHEDPTIIKINSRRVALMMGRPIREDLESVVFYPQTHVFLSTHTLACSPLLPH